MSFGNNWATGSSTTGTWMIVVSAPSVRVSSKLILRRRHMMHSILSSQSPWTSWVPYPLQQLVGSEWSQSLSTRPQSGRRFFSLKTKHKQRNLSSSLTRGL